MFGLEGFALGDKAKCELVDSRNRAEMDSTPRGNKSGETETRF
jgi:hypothetical protein